MPDPVKKKKKVQKKPSNMPGRPAGYKDKKGRKPKKRPTQTGYGPQNRTGIAPKKKKIVRRAPKKKIKGYMKDVAAIAKGGKRRVVKKRGVGKVLIAGAKKSAAQLKQQQSKANKATNKAMVDKKILAARAAYQKKHGSNSGGTDAQFKAYQANLNKIRKGY